jgi:transcriptional regulator with XRE-family HTH domain
MDINEAVAIALRAAKAKAKTTDIQIARAAGITETTVSRLLNGHRPIRVAVCYRLAEAVGSNLVQITTEATRIMAAANWLAAESGDGVSGGGDHAGEPDERDVKLAGEQVEFAEGEAPESEADGVEGERDHGDRSFRGV